MDFSRALSPLSALVVTNNFPEATFLLAALPHRTVITEALSRVVTWKDGGGGDAEDVLAWGEGWRV